MDVVVMASGDTHSEMSFWEILQKQSSTPPVDRQAQKLTISFPGSAWERNFVITRVAAAQYAGSAIVLSFWLVGVAADLIALVDGQKLAVV